MSVWACPTGGVVRFGVVVRLGVVVVVVVAMVCVCGEVEELMCVLYASVTKGA